MGRPKGAAGDGTLDALTRTHRRWGELPRRLPTEARAARPAVGLLAASAIVLGIGVVLLARQPSSRGSGSARWRGWTFLAYIVIAGMIEYAFVYDHTHGTVLVVMTLMLVVFMLAPPLLVGFTVARFQHTA